MTEVMSMLRLVVLVSGTGTLLQSILDHRGSDYEVAAVVADAECPALDRARAAGVPAKVVAFNAAERETWNHSLAEQVAEFRPDLVVSAGFMKILGSTFLERFPGRIINTHPALLPSFPGAHAVRDALAYGVKVTGSTIHFVDEGVDTGAIIAQKPVEVLPGDDEATLHERIKVVERELIVHVLTHARSTAQGEVQFPQ